jgi:hypothetical protein
MALGALVDEPILVGGSERVFVQEVLSSKLRVFVADIALTKWHQGRAKSIEVNPAKSDVSTYWYSTGPLSSKSKIRAEIEGGFVSGIGARTRFCIPFSSLFSGKLLPKRDGGSLGSRLAGRIIGDRQITYSSRQTCEDRGRVSDQVMPANPTSQPS